MWKDDGAVNWQEVVVRLTQWVRRQVADPDDVDDLVQDILERLLRHGERLVTVGNPLGWMHHIAVNTIIDHYRRSRQHIALPDALPAEMADTMDTTRSELAACLRPLIMHLDSLSREALLAIDIGGKSQVDTAREAEIALSTMKSRVQRGRRKLRNAVLRCCYVELDRRKGVIDFSPRQTRDTGEGSCCAAECSLPS